MEPLSFWEQDAFSSSFDLIVAGAGITGLSSALFYKQRNPEARVVVLERGSHPLGASTRNAGFACVGSIGEHLADLQKETEAGIKRRIKWRYRGLTRLKETLGERAIGYEHCGGYELFKSKDALEEAASEIERFNRWMEELTGEKTVYKTGELEGYPVICNRLEGALHPGMMMRQLTSKVMETGVDILWRHSVDQVDPDGRVSLQNGATLKAPNILLAVNGLSQRLLPAIDIKPARGLILVTNKQDHLPWKGTFHYDRGYTYFRNIGDRLLIGGARNLSPEEEETYQFGTNDIIRNHLADFVSGVLKLPAGWTAEYQWSGIMGFTESKTPIIKQVDEHRYIAAGLSGMGVAIGMEVGRSAAEMITRSPSR